MPLRLLLSGGHRRLCMRREDKMELRQSRPLYNLSLIHICTIAQKNRMIKLKTLALSYFTTLSG